jgi:O-antigen/teichoic acid export membrane protein
MLITGTVAAQVIPIVLQPFLRRVYTPEDFGVFAVYTSLLGIVVSVSNLRYESTVMLPRKDEDAANLVIAGWMISFVMASISAVVLLLFGDKLLSLFDVGQGSVWLFYLLPVSIFLFSAYQSVNYYLIRKKAFKVLSLNKVVRRGGEGIVQIGAGFNWHSIGLICGTIAGDLMNFLTGIIQLRRQGFKVDWIKKVKIIALMKRYKDFPMYNTLPALLNTMSLSLPVLMISNFYGEKITGFFDLSRMVLALPLALVSVSVSQVLFQHLSEKIRERKPISGQIRKTAKFLGISAVIMVVVGYFLSVPVFKLVFGDQWELSGVMTQILIASYALKFVVSPLSITFNALEKIRSNSLWQLLYFLSILSLFFFRNLPVEEFLMYYLVIDLVAYTIYFALMTFQVSKYEKSLKNA